MSWKIQHFIRGFLPQKNLHGAVATGSIRRMGSTETPNAEVFERIQTPRTFLCRRSRWSQHRLWSPAWGCPFQLGGGDKNKGLLGTVGATRGIWETPKSTSKDLAGFDFKLAGKKHGFL